MKGETTNNPFVLTENIHTRHRRLRSILGAPATVSSTSTQSLTCQTASIIPKCDIWWSNITRNSTTPYHQSIWSMGKSAVKGSVPSSSPNFSFGKSPTEWRGAAGQTMDVHLPVMFAITDAQIFLMWWCRRHGPYIKWQWFRRFDASKWHMTRWWSAQCVRHAHGMIFCLGSERTCIDSFSIDSVVPGWPYGLVDLQARHAWLAKCKSIYSMCCIV